MDPGIRKKVEDYHQWIVKQIKKARCKSCPLSDPFKYFKPSRSHKDTKQNAIAEICNTWGIFTCKSHSNFTLQLVETTLRSLGPQLDVIKGCFPANITMYLDKTNTAAIFAEKNHSGGGSKSGWCSAMQVTTKQTRCMVGTWKDRTVYQIETGSLMTS